MKKITAILTLTVLLLTAVSAAGCFAALFFGTDTVASLSEARKNAVAASLGIAEPEYPDIEVEDECGLSRFIVKFKKDASFGEIERAFGSSGAAYGLISDGEGRFFSVRLADPEDFFDENRGIIDYYEADTVRSALSVTNDPVQMPAYEYMDVYGAWDKVTASGDIIVAVLDTGVFRKHEDLKTVNILPGYDAVNRVSGVKTDSSGHGTAVTGVIAAAANNKAGIAGVAYGVTVLPVKVSSTRSTIYSSDLINGIRFAADAGADIINLSVGGYSSSAAEQEAIDYALSKGCIVVAASGNEGDRSIAGQKCYPASYDGVISVASCNGKGKRSSFSQYNECVDVAAPGENVTVPVWDSGSSGYRQDSGTSYSAAFVSGIAALLLSGTEPGVRFGQEEFMSVIISTCGASRNDSLGYGVINALEAAERSALPVITGVTDGGVYNEKVYIGFNRGTATLDSEPVFDGEPVVTNGKHFLEVTDGENTVSASFRVDYRPISAQYREYDGYSAFEFTSGTALLDGFPYVSGTPVTSSGSHYFRLSEGDEVFKKTVVIKASRPEIYGVENGGYYTSPVGIKVAGASKVTLDGRLAGSEIAVCESGDHVLKVYGADAETFRSVCFTVDTGGSRKTFKGDLADPLFTVDEEYGYILLYGKDLVGARVCAISSPDKIERIVELGAISSAAISGEKVYLYGENGLSVLDRAKIMTEEDCLIKVIPLEEVENCVFGGDKIYCFGGGKIYVLDVENETLETIAEPSLDCEKAVYCDGMICMLQHSGDTGVTVFDCETCGISSVDLGVRIMPGVLGFYGGYIAVGGRLYDSEGGFIRAFGCTRTVAVSGGLLFTDSRVYFIENGGIAAYCPEGVFGVFFGERINCVFCDDGRIDVSEVTGDKAADCGALPAADRETTLPEASDVYRSERFFDPGLDVISASAYGDTLFVIYNGEPALEAIPAGQGIAEKIRLRAFPTCVTAENGALCVSFAGENFIYRAPYDRPGEGEYISVPGECAKAFAFGSGIAAICGGELVLLGEETLFTGIPADTAAPALENIAVLYGKTLSVYDSSLQNLASATVSGNGVVAGGGHIAVGGRVYSASDLHAERTFKQYVIALEGDLAVTADGIYSVTDGRRFGEICCPSADLAAFFGNNFACVTDGMIIFISAEEGGLTADPELTGIAEDGFYNSPDAIGYSFGTAFLDGVPYDPAAPVGAGGHTFVLSLPFARSIVCPFTVAAKLEGIEFVEPERVMNLGDTITLRIKYLPEGTGSVRVSFDFPGEGIYVDEYGVVTANATGKYTVTAAVAEQPGLTAKCTVTVRDDLITFPEESGLRVDRNNGILIGVYPGTGAETLLSMLPAGQKGALLDSEGGEVTGLVSTGDRLVIYREDGGISDSLLVAVRGDTDGDGYITAHDLYILERILKGYKYAEQYVAAADFSGNGIGTNADYYLLSSSILGKTGYGFPVPPDEPFGTVTASSCTKLLQGDVIDVALSLNGAKYACAVSGTLIYSDSLEFVSAEGVDWEFGVYDSEGELYFYAYSDDGGPSSRAFRTVAHLRFRVVGDHGAGVNITSNGITASFGDHSRVLRFTELDLAVSEREYGDMDIKVFNAPGFDFSPDVHDYSVAVAYDAAMPDIYAIAPEGYEVSVKNAVISGTDKATARVIFVSPEGGTYYYTLAVTRDSAPKFDPNCNLARLEVEGFRLTPEFDPQVFLYSVEVPYGTENINLYCLAQNRSANVIVGDTTLTGDLTAIRITVATADGESQVYTVLVSRLPDEEDISEDDPGPSEPAGEPGSSDPAGASGGLNPAMIAAVAAAVLIAAAAAVLLRRKKKGTEKTNGQ